MCFAVYYEPSNHLVFKVSASHGVGQLGSGAEAQPWTGRLLARRTLWDSPSRSSSTSSCSYSPSCSSSPSTCLIRTPSWQSGLPMLHYLSWGARPRSTPGKLDYFQSIREALERKLQNKRGHENSGPEGSIHCQRRPQITSTTARRALLGISGGTLLGTLLKLSLGRPQTLVGAPWWCLCAAPSGAVSGTSSSRLCKSM